MKKRKYSRIQGLKYYLRGRVDMAIYRHRKKRGAK
jgi:hypothetical protein